MGIKSWVMLKNALVPKKNKKVNECPWGNFDTTFIGNNKRCRQHLLFYYSPNNIV